MTSMGKIVSITLLIFSMVLMLNATAVRHYDLIEIEDIQQNFIEILPTPDIQQTVQNVQQWSRLKTDQFFIFIEQSKASASSISLEIPKIPLPNFKWNNPFTKMEINVFDPVNLSNWWVIDSPEDVPPSQKTATLPKGLKLLEPAAGEEPIEEILANITEPEIEPQFAYAIEETLLETEAVLVPRQTTVVSSSRTGKIIRLPFNNGDLIKKDDILVEYACEDLHAELDSLKERSALSKLKSQSAEKLFKLEIISNIEHADLLAEYKAVKARTEIINAQLKDCVIKADFDGRVTNRLANEHEYTRTDRVLLEVASTEKLNAKLLIPSYWLRWINIGAPLNIKVIETDEIYDAQIIRIDGEVDPVSQSIQIEAELKPYSKNLLPGMSGTAELDAQLIRQSGIVGFLE